MKVQKALYIILFLFAGSFTYGQNKAPNSRSHTPSEKNQINQNSTQTVSKENNSGTGKSASLIQVDSADNRYHQNGISAEKVLMAPGEKSDKDLKEKEFIIERSEKIKIIYKPSSN